MSMRLLMTGYSLSLVAVLLGCVIVVRSRYAFRGIHWLIGSVSAAFLGVLLLAGRGLIPDFLSIVIANEAILAAWMLVHGAIAAILNSHRRHLGLSASLGALTFAALLYFTYVSRDITARTILMSTVVALQCSISAVVLFRCDAPALRSPIRTLAWTLVAFDSLHAVRIILTILWPPPPDFMHPDLIQSAFSLVHCIMGLGNIAAVLWLALCAQRDELHALALTDGLTGLMNRRGFDEILEREMCRSHQDRGLLALLLIDLDHFKAINDNFGHQAGGDVIRRVGLLLRSSTRAADTVARYGGEEFVMLLRGSSLDRAESIAERLLMEIAALRGLPHGIHLTASIGIAVDTPEDTEASLLKRSDDALYLSKRLGRNRVSTEAVWKEY